MPRRPPSGDDGATGSSRKRRGKRAKREKKRSIASSGPKINSFFPSQPNALCHRSERVTGADQSNMVMSTLLEFDRPTTSTLDAIANENDVTTDQCGFTFSPEVWESMCLRDSQQLRSSQWQNRQSEIAPEMRSRLVDWLMEVSESERLHRESLHLAVDVLDRFMCRSVGIPRCSYQMVGVTALFIATKYEEIYPPKLIELVDYGAGSCTAEDCLQMEVSMMDMLEWRLSSLTSIHWLTIYLHLLGNAESTTAGPPADGNYFSEEPATVLPALREDFIHMARILDLCLLEPASVDFSHRRLAAAVLFACYEPSSEVERATGISYVALAPELGWIAPIVAWAERHRPAGDPIRQWPDVHASDAHNIQVYPLVDLKTTMEEISADRQRRSMEASAILTKTASSLFRSGRVLGTHNQVE